MDHGAAQDHQRRQPHVAGPAHDGGQQVEQPERDRAGEHDARVGDGDRQRAAGAAHCGIERGPAEEEARA